ncbi:hypothetical protein OG203_41140 [Nocardia sp. NBC_01499]|uniref:hypothetical protein n=1 Tax=Nocardia sp. NBC_01499 TaxID=2903597 RepID=UPI003864497A
MPVQSFRRRRIGIRLAAAAAVVAVPAVMVAAPAMAAPTAISSPSVQLIDDGRHHHCNAWDRDDFCRDRGAGDWHRRPDGGWDRDNTAPQPAPAMPPTGSSL